MTPARLEPLLLLEQSGELTGEQRRTLDAELAANPDARRLCDELRGLARAIPPAPGPSPDAAARIAARLATAARPRPAFHPAWKPALAAAAALALLLGIQLFRAGSPSSETQLARSETPAANDSSTADDWTDPLADDFTELENLLTALSAEDPFGFAEL